MTIICNNTVIEPKYGLILDVVEVTPEMARAWLESAPPNRRLRQVFVRQLSADIQQGRWLLNGAPLRFDTDGRLIDGQHRLSAILHAGMPVLSVVVYGINSDARDTLDEGLARRFADVLRIRGEKYYAVLAAATGWHHRYTAQAIGEWSGSARVSIGELSGYLSNNPSLRIGAEWASTSGKNAPLQGSLLACLYSLFGSLSESDRDEFLTALISGEYLNAEHPVFLLRETLARARMKTIGRPRPYVQLAWTIKAWNAYRDSEPLKLLKWAPWKEDFPVAI
jgi:hypothetical protein